MTHDGQTKQLVTMETARFSLRGFRDDDAQLIAHFTADRRIAMGTRSIPHPLPDGTAENFVARAQHADSTEDVWAIDGRKSSLPHVLGIVSLERMDRRQSEVFFWVAPDYWNLGVATEVVQGVIDSNPHNAVTFFAEVFKDAPRSARVLTNCAFKYIGDAEAYSLARDAVVPTQTYVLSVKSR